MVIEDVRRHAEQFDQDLRHRPAGSQQEFAAATYLLGHLQRAGYVVQLDYVPVKDLVRSTNVVAQAPRGEPRVVVVIPYDGRGGGEGIGVFLETARALRVRAADHAVEFVALGAERATVSGGLLGSRRLARRLLDDGVEATIVELTGVGTGEPLVVAGDAAVDFLATTGGGGEEGRGSDRVWGRAGFRHALVSGDPAAVGAALLDFLEGPAG
ncbi:MAG: hypothetical protein GEU78_04210 [Actinobacteria bacterium]|nr:hypothetical protein [Actinomycetota bacterium]